MKQLEREIKITICEVWEKGTEGICSLVCGYLLKCLIDYSGEEEPPKKGAVSVVTPNPCKAFSCYKNAFAMNGYRLKNQQDVKEALNEYIDELEQKIKRDLNSNDDDSDDDDYFEFSVDLQFERM